MIRLKIINLYLCQKMVRKMFRSSYRANNWNFFYFFSFNLWTKSQTKMSDLWFPVDWGLYKSEMVPVKIINLLLDQHMARKILISFFEGLMFFRVSKDLKTIDEKNVFWKYPRISTLVQKKISRYVCVSTRFKRCSTDWREIENLKEKCNKTIPEIQKSIKLIWLHSINFIVWFLIT